MSEILVNTIKKADGTGGLTVPTGTGTVATLAGGTFTGDITMSSADLVVGSNSIFIGGTGSANELSDYEEGTWDPTWTSTGGTINTNTTFSEGRYTKIGREVTVHGRLYTNSVSSPTGTVTVSGLPFAVANTPDNENPFVFYVTQLTGTLSGTPMGITAVNTSTMTVVDQVFGSGGKAGDWADHFNNDVFAWFSTTYMTA